MNMQTTNASAKWGQLALFLALLTSLTLVSVIQGFWRQNGDDFLKSQAIEQPAGNPPAFGMMPFPRSLEELARRR